MDTSSPAERMRHLMDLLWRARRPQQVRPGPRARISVDDIVGTAIAWADERGLETLTMRDLAGELGVKPMTLYTHVPDKATLIALMIDAAMGEHRLEVAENAPWRDRVRAVVEGNRELFLQHPWLLQTWSEQPPFGPGVIGKYERELAALAPIGLPDGELDAVLTHVIAFVRGATADLIVHRSAPVTNPEWWAEMGPELARYVTSEEYPLATRIGAAAGERLGGAYDAEEGWRFGLERLLDGLAPIVAARHADRD